ncbi:MAG: DUF362 domain-containing protein [Verrucomicrobiae bacterium]|nr:DUF362 domain-containing protein [Verrucomicrobiae bacterium]
MPEPLVSLERCDRYDLAEVTSAVKRALAPFGGMAAFVRPGMRVALKPNLIMPRHPDEAATTHPILVEAVARMAVELGAAVVIADSPGGAHCERNLRRIYDGCGMTAAAARSGATLNFDLGETTVHLPQGARLKSMNVLKPLATADLVINLPKLKSHGQMVYTGAVKNLFGAIAGIMKGEYHLRLANYDHFANALIDVFLAVSPRLTIMDAIMAMEGEGPTAGKPRPLRFLMAGTDAFAMDLVATDLIGLKPGEVPMLRQSMVRELCPASVKNIRLAGADPARLRVADFDLPGRRHLQPIEFFDKGILRWAANTFLRPRPVVNRSLCTGCRDCERHCPAKVIHFEGKYPLIDLKGCIRCFCCQELCPAKALKIVHPPGHKFMRDHVAPIAAKLLS